jgi:hypothetical protein
MSETLIIVCVAVCIVSIIIAMFAVTRYQVNFEIKQKQKAEEERTLQQQEKSKKYSEITLDNPLLNEWKKSYFIVFSGHQGAGKTITANLLAHFICFSENEKIRKFHRQHKYLYPETLEIAKKLEKAHYLPVFSNIDLQDRETGFVAQKEWREVLAQRVEAIRGGVILVDELRKEFPKELSYELAKKDADKDLQETKDSGKFLRQKLGMHLIGTEQTQSNYWKGLRDAGETIVEVKETNIKISKFGKFLRFCGKFLLAIMPAIFTTNIAKQFEKNVFFIDKINTFFRLFLPAYISCPYDYYYQKRQFSLWIDEHFSHYYTLLEFHERYYWLHYTNDDLFRYDTTYFRKEYEEKMREEQKLQKEKKNV